MRPPYDPGHVEAITHSSADGGRDVVVRCSCATRPLGRVRLGQRSTCRTIIDILNAHRSTYVTEVPA